MLCLTCFAAIRFVWSSPPLGWACYVANLLPDEEAAKKSLHEVGSKDVRRIVEKTIQAALKNPQPEQWKPILAARNLFFVLDEQEFSNIWLLTR